MLYTKDGYPEVNEIIKCTVKKISGNTTFVTIDEYEKEGVLLISEISPGRIRNIRDYVVENKTIVCKVLRIDQRQSRIDVSLRRVSINAKKDKLDEIKKEEYAERIYQDLAKQLNSTKDELFERTYEPIFEEYETVFEALYEIMLDNKKIEMFKNLKNDEKQKFLKIINDRIKPEEITFKKKFKLFTTKPNGIDLIKSSISNSLKNLNHDKISVSYLAAGKFIIIITHEDMKSADKLFNSFKNTLQEESKQNKISLEI